MKTLISSKFHSHALVSAIKSPLVIILCYYMILTIRRSESAKPKHLVVDGIDVNRLSTQELYGLLDAEDEKFTGNLGK